VNIFCDTFSSKYSLDLLLYILFGAFYSKYFRDIFLIDFFGASAFNTLRSLLLQYYLEHTILEPFFVILLEPSFEMFWSLHI